MSSKGADAPVGLGNWLMARTIDAAASQPLVVVS
jgi:hypothetical protein